MVKIINYKTDSKNRRFPKEYATYGESIRKLGGYKAYHRWLRDNPIRSVKIGRNQPCPCDSGNKYKKCCMKNR